MNSNNENNELDRVAIIGIGHRVPSGGNGVSNELWNQLYNAFDGVTSTEERWSENYNLLGDIYSNCAGLLPLDEWKSFDPLFFGLSPSETPLIDPQQRLLLKCVWEALEDAKINPLSIRGSKTSTFVGCSSFDYLVSNKHHNEVQTNIFASTGHSLSNRISYCFDFHGKSMTIDTACSSSLNATELGYQSIKNGESNLSIVCGVNLILDPHTAKSFSQLGILSKSGACKPFDADADGFVRCELAGAVVLKSLKQAIKDGNTIYCVIEGSCSNVDGNGNLDKLNFYSPSKLSQSNCIKEALLSTNGRVNASDIEYVEAHGTGTKTGDPIELEGISMALTNNCSVKRKDSLLIGSIKSNIGHSEAASGIASLIKCCLMFKHQCFVPNNNFNKPNPLIKFDEWNLKVVTEPIPFSKTSTAMAINNFGVTGSNVCLILSSYKVKNDQSAIENCKTFLIPFSANSRVSLEKYKSLIQNNYDENGDFSQFVKQQIECRSTQLFQRSVVIASNWDEFNQVSNEIKSSYDDKLTSNMLTQSNKKDATVVFIFCGQGSQYPKMCKQLYDNEPIFKKSMDLLNDKLSKLYGYSVFDRFNSINENDLLAIHDPLNAQPLTCMIQISLFQLYQHWGIKPSILIGHSLGEIATAYCSGMIDLDTCCYLIYHRSIEQSKTNGCGKMLSINISADEFKSKYSLNYPSIEIACYNSPTSIVVAGNKQQLNEISKDLKDNGVFSAMLGSLSSFHTSSQSITKDGILNLNINSKSPTIPTFSTVTTNLFSNDKQGEPFNASYVYENIIQPVKFSETIENVYKYIESNGMNKEVVFIEIAPHPTLSFYLKQMIPVTNEYFKNSNGSESVAIYSPLSKKKSNDLNEIHQMLSKLYCNGFNSINFKCQLVRNGLSHTNEFNLPLYQWDDQKYWKIDSFNYDIYKTGPPVDHLGISNSNHSSIAKSYQTYIDIGKKLFQWLKGHQVNGKYYFPGCGYIDNIIQLFSNGGNNQQQSLQDILIHSLEFEVPLILSDGNNQCLQTNIISTSKKEYKVLFHIKDKKSNEWIQLSNGHFQLFNRESNDLSKLDINEIKSTKCNLTKLSKNELYNHIKIKTGINYSGYFQGVEECYLGDNCSLSIVSLELPFIRSTGSSPFFNASIMDCCLHGMIGLIDIKSQVLFQKIQGLTYYSSNIPIDRNDHTNVYVYSRLISYYHDSISASIVVMLQDGTVLYEIDKVVCKSTTPIKDPLLIEYPTDKLYTSYSQTLDSPFSSPSSFNHIYKSHLDNNTNLTLKYLNEKSKYESIIPFLLYSNLNKRCPEITIDQIKSMDISELKLKYFSNDCSLVLNRIFTFVIETIKEYYNDSIDISKWNKDNVEHFEILTKSTRIMSKMLFPLPNDDPSIDLPQSLFENGLIDQVYSNEKISSNNQLIGEVVGELIKPLVNEKMILRILEFGGGVCSLSEILLDKINLLLEQYPNYQIDIEYTWSDISPSFIPEAKSKLSRFSDRVKIIYKSLDLEEQLISIQNDDGNNQIFKKQLLNQSYYDFVVMSNVLHVIKDLKFGINQIYQLLTPNGQLIFVEPIYKSLFGDSVFGVFSQWWTFEDTDLRVDRCCMQTSKWKQLLIDCNFKSDIHISNNGDVENYCFVIQAQKPSLLESPPQPSNPLPSFDKTIIYGSPSIYTNNLINSIGNNGLEYISNVQQVNEMIQSNLITNQSIIYFIKTIDQLSVDNFKEITYEFIQTNQLLLQYNLQCKHVLVTCDSQSPNYLSSSVIGCARYFLEYPQLKLITLNFDSNSINGDQILISKIIDQIVVNSGNFSNHISEFLILNQKVYYERLKRELKLKNTFANSNSYLNLNDKDDLAISLTKDLDYQLSAKSSNRLGSNQVEVKILAAGINYKDYLLYKGFVDESNIDFEGRTTGCEFSGVITKIGNHGDGNSKFKVGDLVFGCTFDPSTLSAITSENLIHHIPSNITFSQAASIPLVYCTSYYSLYKVGALENDEAILIHSATGGVGLSALEILKWKGHTGLIFVTVGSNDKKQYLIDNYGDFITGIYSSRNKNFVNEMKLKIKELQDKNYNVTGNGVDLLLNTLSSNDFMDSNFKCLNQGGRIIDLSITHLNSNEFTNNNNFKFNYGYHNIELAFITKRIFCPILEKISSAIASGELKLIPITEFSMENYKDGIEYINQRKHIGKIVINFEKQDQLKQELIKRQQLDSKYSILKSDYKIQSSVIGKNIIITGQSGIILDILKWMVKYSNVNSIENIIILSKSSLKWELELFINKSIKNNDGIKFHFKSVDVGNSELVNQAIDDILNNNPSITNIDSIFHYAFAQTACKVNEINMNHLDISHGAKTMGAINLHNQSIQRNWKLINFVLASSIASILGSTDQCSYMSSCCLIDSFSRYRKSIGLPSISTNYGLILSTGFVSKNDGIAEMLDGEGINPYTSNILLGSLDLQLQNQNESTNLTLCEFDFNKISKLNKSNLISKISYHIKENEYSNKILSIDQFSVGQSIICKISDLLSIDVNKINENIRLIDYGADSLVLVSLKNWIDKEFDIPNIITIQQLQNNTISSSIDIIKTLIDKKKSELNKNNYNIKTGSFARIYGNSPKERLEYWKNEMKFDDSLTISNKESLIKTYSNGNAKRVLLTDALCYFGVYLLSNLIKSPDCSIVYCLIKSKSINSIDEIINQLKYHHLYYELNQEQLSKINIISGDLLSKQFGISNDLYSKLSENVNLIINSSSFGGYTCDYQTCKPINVSALNEIIRLSINSNPPKRIVSFSSYSVFCNQSFESGLDFNEQTIFPSIENIDNTKIGYIQSKIVAENLINKASQSFNIESMIIRIPALFSNPFTGIGDDIHINGDNSIINGDTIFQLFLQSCFVLGYYPTPYEYDSMISPITWVVNNSINLILNENCWNNSSRSNATTRCSFFNVVGDTIQQQLNLEFLGCKPISTEEWYLMLFNSNDKTCIQYLPTIDTSKLITLDKSFSISKNTKSLLQSMGGYDDDHGDDDLNKCWRITDKIIKNHINHTFEK